MSSITFDELIEYQHDKRKESWVMDGRPRGMFYRPTDGSTMSMWFASFSLPRSKPEWVVGDSDAEKIYSKYKFWGKIIKWYSLLFIPLVIVATCI